MGKKSARKLLVAAFAIICLSAWGFFSRKDDAAGPSGREEAYCSMREDRCNIGIYVSETEEFLALEERPDLLGWFEKWFEQGGDNKLKMCGRQHEAIPMITWEPIGAPMERIAQGEYDDYIRSYCERIRDFCPHNDVLIRFAHEMEMRPQYRFSWYEWQGLEPEVYIAAWIHVVTIGREICPNIKWVWSPNHADEFADPYYPGDDYVDYVGITQNLTVKEYYDIPYENAEDYFIRVGQKAWLERYDKPLIVSEFAYSDFDLAKREAYFESLFDMIEHNPQLRAVLFFNYDNTITRDFAFSGEPSLLRIFTEGTKRIHAAAP